MQIRKELDAATRDAVNAYIVFESADAVVEAIVGAELLRADFPVLPTITVHTV